MDVSVVIPVYNAARFVEQAVQSVLAQPEAKEVILVEDNSPDDSYSICQALAAAEPRVRLLTHPNHENRGAGETRNLGIASARCDLICFLDADDYMLAGRFAATGRALAAAPDADGVYEAVGIRFATEALRANWIATRGFETSTVSRRFAPEELFFRLAPIQLEHGFIHTNGWTFRRAIFERSGLFNPALRLHQDSELFMRLCAVGRFVPGSIVEPVAIRRVHEDNRISAKRSPEAQFEGSYAMWRSIMDWTLKRGLRRHALAVAEATLRHFYGYPQPRKKWTGRLRSLAAAARRARSPTERTLLLRAWFNQESAPWRVRAGAIRHAIRQPSRRS